MNTTESYVAVTAILLFAVGLTWLTPTARIFRRMRKTRSKRV